MIGPQNENNKKSELKVIPLKDCLAKTIHLKTGDKPGVSVETHSLIVGYVARELLSRLPLWLRKNLFPKGSELIAAAHDIGKVSPVFQEKIHKNVRDKFGTTNYCLDEKYIGWHWSVSQATLTQFSTKYIPEIVGRHHGSTPSCINSFDSKVYGGIDWQKQRLVLLEALKKNLNLDWPIISSALQADVLSGLTTVADWIGSGSLFDKAENEPWKDYVSKALDKAGFTTPIIHKGLTFKEVFGDSPYSAQTQFTDSVKTQGVYVLEAPMGFGKTEAALYAAYKILEKGDATGIYFALPTQLTSDKIHERMNLFLGGNPKKNTKGILDKANQNHYSLLLHSSAWLLKNTELGEDGAPGKSWFNNSKRGLLAPFAVGTIDQALMAVMNVKHGFVRTFGLAGKVVVLDEVHSYDSYTGTILQELVKELRKLHCTVIILSATLTDEQRHSIIGVPFNTLKIRKSFSPYPLISMFPKEDNLKEIKTEELENFKIRIKCVPSDNDAIEEVLKRAERGEQILWIENTVKEAQEKYCLLAAKTNEINLDCGLLHSRFLKVDRRKIENKWVKLFGKDGQAFRKEKGRILVGTQVLEQSLDIDADFLVTRLCPTDMIFQRFGRLWRHRENDAIRPSEAKREAYILTPDLDSLIKNENSIGNSAKVYSPYVLCRTLEIWQEKVPTVSLPLEIRILLEATYKERYEKDNMAKYKKEMKEKRNKLHGMALIGLARIGNVLPESKATTRYSETESTEVLLIKKRSFIEKGTQLRLLDDSELLLPKFVDAEERRKISVELLNNTVSVPVYLAPTALTRQMEWLRKYVYLGNEEESPFRVAIVSDNNELEGLEYSDVSEKYILSYDSCLGYRVKEN